MDNKKEYSLWPCPYCGSFKLVNEKMLSCEDCGESIRKSQYKTTIDYAGFVYRFGHLFRSVYEKQLAEEGKLTPVRMDPAHPIAIATSLVILSALHAPSANWFLIKQSVKRFSQSYKVVYGDECQIAEEELRAMSSNIREFSLDFSESSTALRNAVFEEIFAEYCSKKEHDKLLQMQQAILQAKEVDQKLLREEFDTFFQKTMSKTFKKVAALPKPEPAELGTYWTKILEKV